jgi:protocatechuate 3,4-dioxygenase beta subunit
MERKNFLRTLAFAATAGPMVLEACSKSSDTTPTTTSDAATTSTTTTTGSCIVTPTEVEGPYPYPGGESTNPLLRSDVTGGQTGVPLTLSFIVVNTNSNCNVLTSARVDIWHCNKDGYYSGYGNQTGGTSGLATSYIGETWLRGYQTTDSAGVAKFITIFPGWYQGRATHIHMEVFVGGVLKKTAQVAFDKTTADTVHTSSLYKAHGINTTLNAGDGIFGNSATDLANETLVLTGNTTDGYVGTYTIGIAL